MSGRVNRGGTGGGGVLRKSRRIVMKAKERRQQQSACEYLCSFRGHCCEHKGPRRRRRRTVRSSVTGQWKSTKSKTAHPKKPRRPVAGASKNAAGPSSSSKAGKSSDRDASSNPKLGWFSSTLPFDGGASEAEIRDQAMAQYRKEMEIEIERKNTDEGGPAGGKKLQDEGGEVPVRKGGGSGAGERAGWCWNRRGKKKVGGPRNIDFDFENDADLKYFFDVMKVSRWPLDSDDEEEEEGAAGVNPGGRPPPNNVGNQQVQDGRGRRVKSTPRKIERVVQKEVEVVYENTTPPPASPQGTPPEGPSTSG